VTSIIDTRQSAHNATAYLVEVDCRNPITDATDFFRFLVIITDVCPGDVECISTATRCVRAPAGLDVDSKCRAKARNIAKRHHVQNAS